MDKKKVLIVGCNNYDMNNVSAAIDKVFETFPVEQIIRNKSVLIKPNLCLSVSPEKNITTNPIVIEQIISKIKGKRQVTIGESHIGNLDKQQIKELWEMTGVGEILARNNVKRNIFTNNIEYYDIGMCKAAFSDIIFSNDIINVPKLKTHGFMLFTGCIKNMYGLLPGNSKKFYHKKYSDPHEFAKFLANIYVFSDVKLNIVDAIMCLQGNGPGMRGISKHLGVIVAGIDGFSVDRVLCKLMGIQPSKVLTNWFGNIPVEELDDLSDIEILGDIEKFKSTFALPDSYDIKQRLISKAFQLTRSRVAISQQLCKRCGVCKDNCPQGAIVYESDRYSVNDDLCIQCYVCDESCKYNAIYYSDHSLVKDYVCRSYVNENN